MSRLPQRRRSLCRVALAALVVTAGLIAPAGAGTVELVSRIDPSQASDTPTGESQTYSPALTTPPTTSLVSADGRFAVFTSRANNLVNGRTDTASSEDVFLHDRQAGTVTLVSHNLANTAAAGGSSPTISADGRWIAYLSSSWNLVAGHLERNNAADVFLYDRLTDTHTLVSHIPGSATSTGNGASLAPFLSLDGSLVAYGNQSTDLVTGQTDTNNTYDLFVFDRATGVNTLVSRIPGSTATTGNGASNGSFVSGDNGWIGFVSSASNLISGVTDTNNASDVFLYERATGTITLVSHAASSLVVTGSSLASTPVLSEDGSWVAFTSWANNLIPGQVDSNSGSDVFLYERATGTNVLVSHIATSAVQAGSRTSWGPSMSSDGRWLAWASYAFGMIAGGSDTNSVSDVFLYDRTTGTSTLVSHIPTSATTTGLGNGDYPFITRDGSRIVFHGYARNLVTGQVDTNSVHDVFVYERASGTVTLASHIPASAATAGNDYSWNPVTAGDGSSIYYRALANNLVPKDQNAAYDIFRFDVATGTVTLVSRRAPGTVEEPPNDLSFLAQTGERVASDNGRYVAFASNATNLVAGQVDTNGSSDVFLFDRVTRVTTLVSHIPGSAVTTSNRYSYDPAISADGRRVVFVSGSTNQVAGQTGDFTDTEDVFLYDHQTGTVTLVSHRPGLPATPGYCCSDWPGISADGNTVVYRSTSQNLVTGQVDTNNAYEIVLWDRTTDTNLLVSHASGLPATASNGRSWPFAMSHDGAWIAYSSDATNLMPAFTDGNGVQSDIVLWERATDTTTLVTSAAGTPTQGGNSYPGEFSISADGRYIAFNSNATNLVAGQTGAASQVYVHDRVTGTNTLVSHIPGSGTQGGNSFSDRPAISANGGYIVFETLATDLGTGITDTNNARDLWVHNRSTNSNLLVSHTTAAARTTAANNASNFARISADGNAIVFSTSATNLAGSDTNANPDVIYYDRPSRTAYFASRSLTSATTAANGGSGARVGVNANGDAAIFASVATNLISIDANAKEDLFLYRHKSVANLSITKDDGFTTVSPGQSLTWTITVTNSGPEAVTGATVTDLFPASVTGVLWSCVSTGGGTCPASGSGNINASVNLPVGATVTFVANGLLDPAASGTLSNTAQVTATGSVDLDTSDNSATDTDTIQ